MVVIYPVPLPTDHRDPLWSAYLQCDRSYNQELIGGPQWDISDENALVAAQTNTERRTQRFVAMAGDTPVGYANYDVQTADSPDKAHPLIYVVPDYRGRGVGAALADKLRESLAADRAIKVLEAWITTPIATGPTLSPPSGHGQIPADHPGTLLALAHGFSLALVQRVSRFDVDSPAVDPQEAYDEAAAVAGPDYTVVTWDGAAPAELRNGLAKLKQRMSTDVPAGELVVAETQWDAQRVIQSDAIYLSSQELWRSVVIHQPTGEVVALSELLRPRGNPQAFVDQGDTIVLPEHRGHRLGMLVKAANLIQLRRTISAGGAIITWNAEENRHMLAVNEALGFSPILVEAAWQLRLDR